MAQFEIIKDVGVTLQKLLESDFESEGYKDVEVYTALPTEENVKKLPALCMFLSAITIDSRHRERSPSLVTTTEADGTVREYYTMKPTIVWLYYMISAWGKSAQEEHVLLALAMKVLSENPQIREENFHGTSLRAGERLPVYVVEESEFGYEEALSFWRSLGEKMRPIVQYRVGARIHADKTVREIKRAMDMQQTVKPTERIPSRR